MTEKMKLAFGPVSWVIKKIDQRYQVRYKFNPKHLAADVFLLLGIFGLGFFNLYLVFVLNKVVVSLQVRLAVTVSEPVKSGEPVVVTVDYFNGNRRGTLESAKLQLHLPDGFVLLESSDVNYDETNHQLVVGEIPARLGGQLKLTGEVWGEFASEEEVLAELSYWQPATDDRSVKWLAERLVMARYQLSGSVVDCSLVMPEIVARGSKFSGAVTCRNNYSEKITGLKLKFIWPENFVLNSSQPRLSRDFWNLGELASGATAALNFDGQLTAKANQENLTFVAEVYGNHNGVLLLDRPSVETKLLYPHLTLVSQKINGTENYRPQLGEDLVYELIYKNEETVDIKDIHLTLNFLAGYLSGSFSSEDNFVANNNSVDLALGNLAVGETKIINFKIKTTPKGFSGSEFVIKPQASYRLPINNQDFLLAADLAPVTSQLTTNLDLAAFARYYTLEGEQLGIGPLPPIVGLPTKYRIFFSLTNLVNPVENVVVSAHLPNNVNWTGEENTNFGSGLTFDPKTRRLSGQLKIVEAGVGYNTNAAVASFTLELNPLSSQVGQVALLLSDISLSGFDTVARKELKSVLPNITTDLFLDLKAKSKGGQVSR